ncbi:MAG: NUDIX domain-containing protein [Bacteroidales bacterium]|nr:NUDIX domain-containing protein [Bacteroidales bacterium]
MYKVFFNQQVIYIGKHLIDDVPEIKLIADCNESNILSIVSHFIDSNKHFQILTNEPAKIIELMKKELLFIQASGGIVENEQGDILFIHRLGKWDFPKGKIEKDESSERAAQREIAEECGLKHHQLIKLIDVSFHVYKMNRKIYFKETWWYHFKTDSCKENLIAQTEEDIDQVIWADNITFDTYLKNTYPLILNLINVYKKSLQ